MFCKKMHQHLRDDACGIRHINKCEVAEEEIHGSVESAVQSDQKDNEEVPQHCRQVHDQEQDKKTDLSVPVTGQAQEDKLSHPCLVICVHLKI